SHTPSPVPLAPPEGPRESLSATPESRQAIKLLVVGHPPIPVTESMRDSIDWHKQAVVASFTRRGKQGEGRGSREAGGASVEKRTETALGVTE
ncbi:unnamed protein product, partial [Scytosiphon promiscuus]